MKVTLIQDKETQQKAFDIREQVFVVEQQVPKDEEYDEFENISRHFLAIDEHGTPCGTARWRVTEKGIKMERFAVLATHRSKGVGSALVKKVLEDIETQENTQGKTRYMHAQTSAMGLYAKFGFEPVGEMFEECDIQHYKMIRNY